MVQKQTDTTPNRVSYLTRRAGIMQVQQDE